MRTSNKTFQSKQEITITKTASTESIQKINENKWGSQIILEVVFFDGDTPLHSEDVQIIGPYYDELMADSPAFAPGKPANEYREIDLWYIIDKIRLEN